MDQETKITYSIVAVLIIFLGGLAYLLQPGDMTQEKTEETYKVETKKIDPITSTKAEDIIPKSTTTKSMDEKTFSTAVVTTSKGVLEITLDEKSAPNTVKNFASLISSKFYDGVRFHRVIKGFMIQTGDPLSKDTANITAWGTGGPGYKFNDELRGDEKYPLGTVAMANSGPNTNGSQFFIVTANPGAPLPPSYTVFGKVTKGIETALAIQEVKTTGSPSDRPLEDVKIEKIELK